MLIYFNKKLINVGLVRVRYFKREMGTDNFLFLFFFLSSLVSETDKFQENRIFTRKGKRRQKESEKKKTGNFGVRPDPVAFSSVLRLLLNPQMPPA